MILQPVQTLAAGNCVQTHLPAHPPTRWPRIFWRHLRGPHRAMEVCISELCYVAEDQLSH